MPVYDVYKFERVMVTTLTCEPKEMWSKLNEAGLVPSRLVGVTLHGDYAEGNYALYDPATTPETPLFHLVERK